MKTISVLFVIFVISTFTFQFFALHNKTEISSGGVDSSKENSQGITTNSNKATEDSEAVVNYEFYLQLVSEVESYRKDRLVSLDDFLKMSNSKNTVILDTRSKAMYDLKHVKGAIHLNFSDFNIVELERVFDKFQGKETRILIYCNNNFFDSKAIFVQPELLLQDVAFVTKSVEVVDFSLNEEKVAFDNSKSLALNIPTFINLYGYGYRNVYELKELVDVNDERIEFEGTFDDN